MMLGQIANIIVRRPIPVLYDLPRLELTFDENDGNDIVFSRFMGLAVALEVHNTSTSTDLVYSINSKSHRRITIAPESFKGYDRTQITSVHIHSGDSWLIRAQVVLFEDILRALGGR